MRDLKRKLENIQDTYLQRDDITGVFVGYKLVKGKLTEDVGFCFHVKEKKPKYKLKKKEIIQKNIDGIPTDIVQASFSPALTYRTRQEIIQPGISIGSESNGYTGTFGCIVYDSSNNPCILTNHHVLVSNSSLQNPWIMQPGALDSGIPFNDRIGYISQYQLNSRGDFATAILNSDRDFQRYILESTEDIISARNPILGETITKLGRTTGETTSTVTAFGSASINYGTEFGTVVVNGFLSTPLVDPNEVIAASGDSGAVWYLEGENIGVGILTAITTSSPMIVFSCYLNNALEDLSLSLNYGANTWKINNELLGFLNTWGTSSSDNEKVFTINPTKNVSNLFLFTEEDYIDSEDNGILWGKRGSEDYKTIGKMSSNPTCILGNFVKNTPEEITIKVKTTNGLNLMGTYNIPIYIGYGTEISQESDIGWNVGWETIS